MAKTICLSDKGDDKNDGSENAPLRTAAHAIKIANRTGAQTIHILGDDEMLRRLTAELKELENRARKKFESEQQSDFTWSRIAISENRGFQKPKRPLSAEQL